MPELPEVQTVVNDLKNKIVGYQIEKVYNPNNYINVLENGSLTTYQKFLTKQTIQSIFRRGKYIILQLDNGFLLFHLRMTGQIILNNISLNDLKYVSFKMAFNDKQSLFFKDVRKFGKIYISDTLNWLENKIGIEPLSDIFNPKWMYDQLKNKQRLIKPFLLDQSYIAGLGNIYADEALWISRIHPKAITAKISKKKAHALCYAIKDVLTTAIKYNGTTIIDFTYGNNYRGSFIKYLNVFRKENTPCPNCNTKISKIFVGQRGTHFCKKCQKIN